MSTGRIGRSMITIRTGKRQFSKYQQRRFYALKRELAATQCQLCLSPKTKGICPNTVCKGDRAQRRLLASQKATTTT